MFRIGKSVETESKWGLPEVWESRKWRSDG